MSATPPRQPAPPPRRPNRPGHILAWLLAAILSLPVAAQSAGTLRGRVADKQGNPLPGAVIAVKSARNPAAAGKGAVTDARGQFRIEGLPPGDDYQISATFPSMATVVQGPVHITSDVVTSLDFVLVQELVTTIRVEAQGSIVDTASATTRTTVNEEFAATLPILGRTYTDLLTLAPGVTDTDGDGKPNVHGSREVDFQIRVDGVSVTDPFGGEDASQINIEAIEELQMILGGAAAEYGRAQGGQGLTTTKSGGNEFEGSFKFYYQTRALDGDGAHSQDAVVIDIPVPEFRTIKPFLTVGGPLVKDRAWYFLANEYIDQQEPINIIGVTRNQSIQGWIEFGKLTWQINPSHKGVLSMIYDPRETTGNRLGIGVSPETDYRLNRTTPVLTAKENSIFSPTVLLESTLSLLDGSMKVRPVGELSTHHITCLGLSAEQEERICSQIPDVTYSQNLNTGQINGPWWVDQDSTSSRLTAKQDLSFYVDDFLGSHQFKVGYEWLTENYDTTVTQRPLRYEFEGSRGVPLFLWADFEQRTQHAKASAGAQAVYLQDSWRILPNLTLNLGVRVDREDVSAAGKTLFDPAQERARFDELAAQVYDNFNPDPTVWTAAAGVFNTAMNPDTGREFCDLTDFNDGIDGRGECNEYDRNELSRVFHRHEAERGQARYFTLAETDFQIPPCDSPDRLGTCRGDESISLKNLNPAPRLSIAYDPFRDGKTKLYGTYGRFYDRLFLATIIPEQARDFTYVSLKAVDNEATSFTDPAQRNFQVYQVDRDLRTPYTDEVTFGIDRELTPEFSVSVRYIRRKGSDQIQTRDRNHFFRDQNQDGVPDDVFLQDDPDVQSVRKPDTFPDLYAVNPFFGGIYFLGNLNTSDYKGLEVNLIKRLHHNWQFDASYTYSEARGFAEAFDDFFLGGDTSQVQNTYGFLSFDERHVIKFNAVANFPKEIQFGTRITWESGLPFSLIRRGFTFDNQANPTFRQIYPTQQRNDQRNTGRWLIDLNLRKAFTMGRAKAGADFTVTNLLNSDDLEIHNINDAFASFQLVDETQRRFGRRFQIGFTMNF